MSTLVSPPQFALGAEVSIAVGPLGRSGAGAVNAGDGGMAASYAYSHSRGLFAGVSMEGSVIMSRPFVNKKFYGKDVLVRDLLSGAVQSPPAAEPLYEALRRAFSTRVRLPSLWCSCSAVLLLCCAPALRCSCSNKFRF
jgi:lipid-binding SYLF domain-containing protein